MQDFKSLKVYQQAYDLSKQIWNDIKDNHNHRLKSQLFGSATSIPANLAEMAAFDTDKNKAHKIQIAIGEANETEYWLDFCKDTGELNETKYTVYSEKIIEIRKMLLGLLKSIKQNK